MRLLTNENYTPFAKNPTLAKFFREIGYADELGSGVRKITKYSRLYSGCEPIFEDKEMFKVTIPLNKGVKKRSVKRYSNKIVPANDGTINGTINEENSEVGTINGTINEENSEVCTINGTLNEENSEVGTINGTINNIQNSRLNEYEIQILTLIKNNSKLTSQKMSEMIQISKRQIDRTLKSLKEKGYIERIGSNKKGILSNSKIKLCKINSSLIY